MEGLMVEAGERKVLAALKLPRDYRDGCFVFDMGNRTCQAENWFQSDWVKQHWEAWHRGPEKGIPDSSIATQGTRSITALSTKAGYVACWELGGEASYIMETQYGTRTVAVHPNTHLLAIGTVRKVLDTASQAIAEVQLWSTAGEERMEQRRRPGSCVINMLWVHHYDGLRDGHILRVVDGRPIGEGGACVVMEGGSPKVVLAVPTGTRNQRGGVVTLLDPQRLTIVEIAEIPDASGLGTISAWPERRVIGAGGL